VPTAHKTQNISDCCVFLLEGVLTRKRCGSGSGIRICGRKTDRFYFFTTNSFAGGFATYVARTDLDSARRSVKRRPGCVVFSAVSFNIKDEYDTGVLRFCAIRLIFKGLYRLQWEWRHHALILFELKGFNLLASWKSQNIFSLKHIDDFFKTRLDSYLNWIEVKKLAWIWSLDWTSPFEKFVLRSFSRSTVLH